MSARSPNCSPPSSRASNISSSTRTARIALLRKELTSPRPLFSPFHVYGEETAGELAIFRTAAKIQATYGAAAIGTAIISKARASPTCWSWRCS